MTRPGTAARRYAEAAFELATAPGAAPDAADRWREDLVTIAGVSADDRVTAVLDNPALPWGERRAVLDRLLEGRVSPAALNLARLLARRGRADLLTRVDEEYRRLHDRSRGVARATVTSASELGDDELDAIRSRVQELVGGTVEVETEIDPSIIGGVTVRVGDRLIDASVRGRLERLRTRLVVGSG